MVVQQKRSKEESDHQMIEKARENFNGRTRDFTERHTDDKEADAVGRFSGELHPIIVAK